MKEEACVMEVFEPDKIMLPNEDLLKKSTKFELADLSF